jgi:hypothetical protein
MQMKVVHGRRASQEMPLYHSFHSYFSSNSRLRVSHGPSSRYTILEVPKPYTNSRWITCSQWLLHSNLLATSGTPFASSGTTPATRLPADEWETSGNWPLRLFNDTVCCALKISKPRPYDPRDDGRVVRDRSPHRSQRDSSPRAERRPTAHPTPKLHRGGPSRHKSRRDLLLDEADKKELEELERQAAEDNQLVKNV